MSAAALPLAYEYITAVHLAKDSRVASPLPTNATRYITVQYFIQYTTNNNKIQIFLVPTHNLVDVFNHSV